MKLRTTPSAMLAIALSSIAPAIAHAQDAGLRDAGPPVDAGGGGTLPMLPSCPGAIDTANVPVSFNRNGPVDFGPGTGMRMVGSRNFGAEFNLLFSGTYRLAMAGTVHVNWLGGVSPLTLSTTGSPGTGAFNVTFGLRMIGRIFILGVAIDLPLSRIIDDMEGMGMRTFDPWQFTFNDATKVELPVSAWRRIYNNSVTIAGDDYPWEIQARYNMQAWARTAEIGFPNRASGAAGNVFGAINETTSAVTVPVPADGRLNLAVRWKPQLRYRGTIQLRLIVSRRVCVLGICTNVDVPTGDDFLPIALSNESLPDPFEPTDQPVLLPLANFNDPEIDFGSVMLGQTAMQNLIILNPGASTLAAGVSAPSDPTFRLGMNSSCVSAGGMGSVPISFSPTSRGEFRSEVLVASNGATNNPHRVRLFGIGADMTRPPVGRDGGTSDGGPTRRDGGGSGPGEVPSEYNGPQIDAACACRVPAAPARSTPSRTVALAALAALGAVAARARRRSH
jgi:MYXO-CTERM domain-containing protein